MSTYKQSKAENYTHTEHLLRAECPYTRVISPTSHEGRENICLDGFCFPSA